MIYHYIIIFPRKKKCVPSFPKAGFIDLSAKKPIKREPTIPVIP
jgi:hypothetical protein